MRRLDGGARELGVVIQRTLAANFPGTEFFIDPIDLTEFGIMWQQSASGAPTEIDVQEFMHERWGADVVVHCGDSCGRVFAGKSGGEVGNGGGRGNARPPRRGTPDGFAGGMPVESKTVAPHRSRTDDSPRRTTRPPRGPTRAQKVKVFGTAWAVTFIVGLSLLLWWAGCFSGPPMPLPGQ